MQRDTIRAFDMTALSLDDALEVMLGIVESGFEPVRQCVLENRYLEAARHIVMMAAVLQATVDVLGRKAH